MTGDVAFLLMIVVGLYFMPTLFAPTRHHHQRPGYGRAEPVTGLDGAGLDRGPGVVVDGDPPPLRGSMPPTTRAEEATTHA